MSAVRPTLIIAVTCLLTVGCGKRDAQETAGETPSVKTKKTKTVAPKTLTYQTKVAEKTGGKPAFKLGGLGLGDPTKFVKKVDKVATTDSVKAALQPLQIMVGKWNALSNKKPPAGFKGSNVFQWQWDYSDKAQPALKMTSDKTNALLDTASLSFSVADQRFTLKTVDPDGNKREFLGKFTMEVQDVPSDDDPDRTERMYKIEFEEESPADPKDHWKIVFNQTENNDFRLEFAEKRRSGNFYPFNIVRNQRDGTSFAKRADDYGDRTCVVSQGLGTETVKDPESGKTFWVCCSGCKAAFEDDPAYWIAKFEKIMEEKNK